MPGHPLPRPCSGEPLRRTWRPGRPVALHATLATLRRGSGDPAYRLEASGAVWRAVRTSGGPAALHLRCDSGDVLASAWGPGAAAALESVPGMLGAYDDPAGFVPGHPLLRAVAARFPGWRVPRTGQVFEVLVPSVLEQKVTGLEARPFPLPGRFAPTAGRGPGQRATAKPRLHHCMAP